MLVCHCNGVSDRAIRRAIREGAASLPEVGQACGAGTCCRGCSNAIEDLIRSEASGGEATVTLPVPAAPARS